MYKRLCRRPLFFKQGNIKHVRQGFPNGITWFKMTTCHKEMKCLISMKTNTNINHQPFATKEKSISISVQTIDSALLQTHLT